MFLVAHKRRPTITTLPHSHGSSSAAAPSTAVLMSKLMHTTLDRLWDRCWKQVARPDALSDTELDESVQRRALRRRLRVALRSSLLTTAAAVVVSCCEVRGDQCTKLVKLVAKHLYQRTLIQSVSTVRGCDRRFD
jgi:hypothetical protein